MNQLTPIAHLDPATLRQWQRERVPLALIDVREPAEYQAAHLEGSQLHPLGGLARSLGELPRDRALVVVCHAGQRALRAAQAIRAAGHPNVLVLAGGVAAWAAARLPLERGA